MVVHIEYAFSIFNLFLLMWLIGMSEYFRNAHSENSETIYFVNILRIIV